MMSNVEGESFESSDCSETAEMLRINDSYFASYENLEVHRLMLNDRLRMDAYRQAIVKNRNLFQGKIVMDVGCGTGILSLFAAEAGAKKVYSVEASRISLIARDIVKQNNFQNVIEIFSCRIEDLILPNSEKVDVIISEWMGFYLLHESMLDSVILARNKFLKCSGTMFPSIASIYACPSNLNSFYKQEIDCWDSLYGYDFSVVKPKVLQNKQRSPQIVSVESSEFIAEAEVIKRFDLMSVTLEDVKQFETKFFAASIKKDICRGIVLWFDCEFPIECKLVFSTGPMCPPTHWKQTIILLPSEISLEAGDVFGFSIKLSQSVTNHRHYNIQVVVLSDDNDHPMPCNCGLSRCNVIKAFIQEQHKLDDQDIDIP